MEMHDVNEIMSIRQGHLKQDIDFFKINLQFCI